MTPRAFFPLAGLALALPLSAAEKITYNDQVMPILKNACLNCHNPDKKKAGLDLSTYQAALAGSDNGKIVQSGNPAASLLVKCIRQTEDPKMPPKGDKLSDADIAILEKWVEGQLLESATGKAVVASNDVQLAVVSLDRPAGPPPMPTADLPLEPLVRSKTVNALVALAASPWAPLVAVGGQKQVVLYDSDKLQELGVLPFPEGFPEVLRFSRNGQLLLTGGGLGGKSGKVVLWKVATGERAGEVGNEFDQVLGADVSPDHAHVALGGPTKILKIYSTKDGKLEQSIKKHTDWITAVAYSPDGKFLASADRSGGIEVWEGATGKEYNALPGHKLAVTALAFMPGVLASASEDGKITLWDVKEGKEIRSWAAHPGGVMSVDFTPDGRLVSSGRDKLAKVWDQNGKTLLTTQAFDDIALRAVIAGERVVAGDWTGQIRVFNFPDSKRLGDLTSNPPSIQEKLDAATKESAEAKGKLEPLLAVQTAAEAQLQAAKSAEPDKAPAPAELKKLEDALDQARAARQQAEAALATASAEADRWQRAQAFMAVHRTRQTLAELTSRYEGLLATAQTALAPIDQLQAEVVASEKAAPELAAAAQARAVEQAKAQSELEEARHALAAAETAALDQAAAPKIAQAALDKSAAETAALTARLETQKKEVAALAAEAEKLTAGSPERGAADAKLSGPNGELTRLQTSVEAAQAAFVAAKTVVETATAQAATATAALAKPRARREAAEAQATTAAKAAVAAAKAAALETEKLAELHRKAPAVAAEAKAAKAQAEQEAHATAGELETAKAAAARVQAEYEARYHVAGAPIASS